jgi:hypothetical protein
VKRPTFRPEALRIDAMIADVEPFPFVPAIWMEENDFCGSPRDDISLVILLRPNLMPCFWRL